MEHSIEGFASYPCLASYTGHLSGLGDIAERDQRPDSPV
jgi:hypothetical protein